MKTSRFIDAQIMAILKQAEDAIRWRSFAGSLA